MRQIDALECLTAGYVNQDWPEEYGTPWSAVEAFVRDEHGHAPGLRSDIDSFLRSVDGDDQVERGLIRLGLGYAAEADGWGSYREWLLAVADRVDELLRGQASERAD